MGFSRQEYWSCLPLPPPRDPPHPGIEPMSLRSPALAGRFFTASATWEAYIYIRERDSKSWREEGRLASNLETLEMTQRTKVLFALYIPHLERAGSYPHPAVTRGAAPWTISGGWVGNWGFHYHLVVMEVCCQGCTHPFQSSVRGGWLKEKLIKIQSPTHNIISKMFTFWPKIHQIYN